MSQRYFDRVETHSNPLVTNAANYVPITNVAPYLRRPRNMLIEPPQPLDPVDPNVAGTSHNDTTPTLNGTNPIRTTNGMRRTRRRARRVPVHTAYTPYIRIPGRFSPPRPSTDTS
ncbi:unnamed protein product [Parnassius apollo]|uniref:(apollo) hypothetical protein n=1 Tax=Parnassius apollo TaxID=110799 RepID=A0A8S3XDT4_PARAO|nr:unnamed protein product [Parnassius apollo]